MLWCFRTFTDKCCNKIDKGRILLAEPDCKYELPLCKKVVVNHNVRIFTFKFPDENMILGHACCQSCQMHAKIGNEMVTRNYTPVSTPFTKGHVEFIIKIYFPGVDPKRPFGGKMTQHLYSLNVGDVVKFSGPYGNVIYEGQGKFTIKRKHSVRTANVKKLSLITGGVGLTPAIQLLRAIELDKANKILCSLVYASQSKSDIVCMDELNKKIKDRAGKLQVWHTIENSAPDWPYSVGKISKNLLQQRLFPPSKDVLNLLSGPEAMKSVIMKYLDELGFGKDMYHSL